MKILFMVMGFFLTLTGFSEAQPMYAYTGFGPGIIWSCATWLDSPINKSMGQLWIGGFFSGLNLSLMANKQGVQVATTTDLMGISAEVEKLCREDPSKSLSYVTFDVFLKLAQQHR